MGRAQANGFAAMLEPVKEQADEQQAAKDAHDQFDGQLIGRDDHAANHIARQHENGPEQRCIQQRTANFVSFEHGHDVGHDQADVRNGADDHHDGRGDGCGDGKAHEQHRRVAHAKVLGKIPAHTHNVEMICKEEGH